MDELKESRTSLPKGKGDSHSFHHLLIRFRRLPLRRESCKVHLSMLALAAATLAAARLASRSNLHTAPMAANELALAHAPAVIAPPTQPHLDRRPRAHTPHALEVPTAQTILLVAPLSESDAADRLRALLSRAAHKPVLADPEGISTGAPDAHQLDGGAVRASGEREREKGEEEEGGKACHGGGERWRMWCACSSPNWSVDAVL